MSNQKALSRLSFVVIALLAAALPCLAQTKSTEGRNVQTSDVSLRPATEIAALGSERLNVYKPEAKPATATAGFEQQRNSARIKFQQSLDEASAAPAALSTISQSDWLKAQRLSTDENSASPKRITFVPSRGQKLPE